MSSGGGDWKALYYAARNGDVAETRLWLSSGADPNLQHVEFGTTPLCAAAEMGHLEVVQLLVEHGADVTIRSDWERTTAREAAAAHGREEVARWLAEVEVGKGR